LSSLGDLSAFVASCLEEGGHEPRRVGEVGLCVEEALVNIASYAYPEGPGEVTVTCRETAEGDLVIEIEDEGIPFDVLAREDPDVRAGLDERQPGGLGIYLIKRLMDVVAYRREGGRNILTLVVKAPPGRRSAGPGS